MTVMVDITPRAFLGESLMMDAAVETDRGQALHLELRIDKHLSAMDMQEQIIEQVVGRCQVHGLDVMEANILLFGLPV